MIIRTIYLLCRRGSIYGPFLNKQHVENANYLKKIRDEKYPDADGTIKELSMNEYRKFKTKIPHENYNSDYLCMRKFLRECRNDNKRI